MRLVDPDTGHIWFDAVDLAKANRSDLLPLRRRIHMVFHLTAL